MMLNRMVITLAVCLFALPSQALKVGLLTPGPISDNGWNAGAYEGLKAIESELGAQVSHVQVRSSAEHEEQFRSYAEEGFDLVFGHGFEFQDAAKRVGRDFPGTYFITTSGNTVSDNVGAMVFELEQATYILGYYAGSMTQTGMVGMIGGVEIPSVESTFLAFEAGVKAANPEAEILRTYTGSWEDSALAREATRAQLQKGADFFFHNANEASAGVFQAVQETKNRTVYVFGANKDQTPEAPEIILASAVIEIPEAFVRVAREIQSGTYEAGIKRWDMNSGVIKVALNPALDARIPEVVSGAVETIKDRIRTGDLVVPRGDF